MAVTIGRRSSIRLLTAIDVATTIVVMTFGERLAHARRAAGIDSARELDRRIGVAEGYTSLLESGARSNPSGKVVVQYATVLDVTAEWLVNGAGEGPQEAA